MQKIYDDALAQKPAKGNCTPLLPLPSPPFNFFTNFPLGQTLRDARHMYLTTSLPGHDGAFGAFSERSKEDATTQINELHRDINTRTNRIFS